MKKSTRFILGGLVIALLAAGIGYAVGNRTGKSLDSQAAAVSASGGENAKKERKLLYYRNPMGLPDTSPVPKKDPMGMDYIPVYEGEDEGGAASASQIRISTEKVQKLGVRTEKAALRELDRTVRAAGRIEPDESRTYAIAPKFEGYVERLYVNTTGQPVGKGQPLFSVYSPELVSAQREYAIAAKGVESLQGASDSVQSGMKQLAESSLLRLKNWDISEGEVKALAKSGEAKRTLTFRSPVSGIVTEKKALQGMRFMPGETLYQVADLSRVWVVADIFEQDIGQVKSGARAKARINAYPDKVFEGKITYVYPTLKAETRTVPVRIELANPGLLLKPGMFAQVELPVGGKGKVLTVPDSSVIDSGMRRIVLVQLQEGRFEPREVRLGARSDNYVEILDGVRDGEDVVVAANFLIDAESNLKAATGAMGAAPAKTEARPSSAGHKTQGTVDEVDAKAGTVSISHGAVPELKWPAMTMEFKLANESLLKGLKPGNTVAFEFVERSPGEWVITSIKPVSNGASGGKSVSGASAHAGH
jgi:Cu(I)/Ag(I) efflux system membrane fusion protein